MSHCTYKRPITRTAEYIAAALPKCLAQLVEDYMLPTLFLTEEALGDAGHYELCERIGHGSDCALRGACAAGHIEIAQLMIARGADPKYGLVGACIGGHADIAAWLLSLGADIITPLASLYAQSRGHHAILSLMAEHAAKRQRIC